MHNYLDRERETPEYYKHSKTSSQPPFIPYTINKDNSNIDPNSMSSYSGSYGNAYQHNQQTNTFWGLPNDYKRNEIPFNYFNLGNGQKVNPNDNSVLSYPGSSYDNDNKPPQGYQEHQEHDRDKSYYDNLWTRRPSQDGEIS